MAEQNKPTPEQAAEPSRGYGREDPGAESGLGRLDNNTDATPTDAPDKIEDAVKQKQPSRQLNADDVVDGRDGE